MTVIEIRPYHWGWKAFESPGVVPVFANKDQANRLRLERYSLLWIVTVAVLGEPIM
jgi:hypothetical protein